MATSGIRVVVKFDKVKDVAGFKAAMKELMEATRKEAGCQMYELFEEVDGEGGEPQFTLLEWWKSAEDIAKHMEAPHVKASFPKMKDLLGARPEIKKYKSLGM